MSVLVFCIGTANSQSLPVASVYIERHGSAPPVPRWYACARNLKDQTFNRLAADQCLQSILSHPYFTDGKIEIEKQKRGIVVSFLLESPSLRIVNVSFTLPTDLRIELENWLAIDPLAPHLAAIYDPLNDYQAENKVVTFLRTKGIVALVSRDINLDYVHKTADLTYRVVQGPVSEPEIHIRPGPHESCKIYVGNTNEINVNDYTPLQLIDNTVRLYDSLCVDQGRLKKAENQLNDTGLFSLIKVSTAVRGSWGDITVTARTNPITVGQVSYRWYGDFAEKEKQSVPAIPLHEGSIYRKSQAFQSADELTDHFSTGHMPVKVFEQDSLTDDKQLNVVFSIIRVPPDRVIIDGNEIDLQRGVTSTLTR
ncbi:MAG TPA: hypothetical protein VN862_07795 [Candidatus Acidoferrales bacterium]|nr:hypothetical protein [Candidatus Acidoferrales bacterium]